jgi:ATP-binding cassette subfamily B protein
MDLLDTPVEMSGGSLELDPDAVRGEIRFEGLSFGYPGRESVLENFSLHVPAGGTIALVGPTGAGKTTIIRLLLRFYDPVAGTISFDGVPLPDLGLASLRRSMGLVSQHPVLFPGTVADNIRYARPGATDEEVASAARVAEAHEFIAALPQGYQTPVGEDGHKLSGGQRQRVAIARAVLKDAPVLIFDEATSAVDNETEAALQRSLARISRDRTTLVIAHRLSTVRNADRVVVLDAGGIVEQGTHDALVNRGGLYQRLWAVQTGSGVLEQEPVDSLRSTAGPESG